jgi:hypothetical protein
MSGAEQKAEAGNKTSLGDLERVVKVRKYDHCRAEYSGFEPYGLLRRVTVASLRGSRACGLRIC